MQREPFVRWSALFVRVALLCAAPIGHVCAQNGPAARFDPITASGRVERTLRQIDALLEDEAWGEALDLIESLNTDHATQLLAMPGPSSDNETWKQYEPVSQRVQRLLSQLDEEGLNAYRGRIDSVAEQLYREGQSRKDENLLARVVREFFASSWCDDALVSLGDLALERGHTAAARRWWRMLYAELNGPYGESIADALAEIDPDVSPQRLGEAWLKTERPESLVVCPSAEIDPADIAARIVVASLVEGNLRRAEIELRLLQAAWPDASGRIAGRDQPYAPALRALIDSQQGTDRPSYSDSSVWLTSWALDSPIPLPERDLARDPQARQNLLRQQVIINQMNRGIRIVRAPALSDRGSITSVQMPVAGSNRAYYATLTGALRQIDYTDRSDSPAPFVEQQPALTQIAPNGNRLRNLRDSRRVHADTITHHQGVLYFVEAQTTITRGGGRARADVNETLRGVDLDRELKEVFELRADKLAAESDDRTLKFAGPPSVHGQRLVVPLVTEGAGAQFSVGCFDTRSRRLWLTPVGTGQYLQQMSQRPSARVSISGDTAYVSTNLGAVSALDLSTGHIRWVTRYPRLAPENPRRKINTNPPSDLVLSGDQLFVAPSDSRRVIAIDTTTGLVRWTLELDSHAAHLLGMSGHSLVVGGDRLRSIDAVNGKEHFVWPDTDRSGIRGMGRGLLIGQEVFWPARDEIYVLDARSGAMTRPPIDISHLGGRGANLALAGQRVLAMGDTAVNLLGPPIPATKEPQPQISRLMDTSRSFPPVYLTSDL